MSSRRSPSSPEHSVRRFSPVEPGTKVAGKYRVDRVLGAGAMGVVVRALHIDLEQEVAIKFLHPELATRAESTERFRREAYSAARIPSAHVPLVYDVGVLEDSNIPFIVMEYLHGRDLARELVARGPLSVAQAARYVLEACDALGEAHARGIVHRDLKPANLFLADGANGTQMIKVLDFGISKTLGAEPAALSLTEPATLMGSPAYMSPEQLESARNVDARTDIWSLGVTLFELVSGSLPFDGESVPQLIRAVIGGRRARLDEPELAPLEPVVARCLQQDREQRFQTVAELCDALSPLVPTPVAGPLSLASMSAPGSRREAPSGDEALAARRQSGALPDSGWGWTHAVRRSSLTRTLVVAAGLGALGAILLGQGRNLLQAPPERANFENTARVETVISELRPPQAASPQMPPAASDAPTVGKAAEATAASGQPPTPPVTARPSEGSASSRPPAGALHIAQPAGTDANQPSAPPNAPPAAAPAPSGRAARAEAGARDDQAAKGPAARSPPLAAEAPAPASVAAPDAAPTGNGNGNAARDAPLRRPAARNLYEIEELGGRE